MTETLKLVVDFMRTKKLDRSCDLLLEEWRLRQTSSSASLENPTKLEGIIAGGVAPAAEGESQRALGDHSGSTKLVPGDIGTADTTRGGAPATSIQDVEAEAVASEETKLTEVQKELSKAKDPHPYGGYAVATLKVTGTQQLSSARSTVTPRTNPNR